MMSSISWVLTAFLMASPYAHSFQLMNPFLIHKSHPFASSGRSTVIAPRSKLFNIYDDWRSDAVVDTLFLDEENVEMCLEEFIDSDYGTQMFGVHERAGNI